MKFEAIVTDSLISYYGVQNGGTVRFIALLFIMLRYSQCLEVLRRTGSWIHIGLHTDPDALRIHGVKISYKVNLVFSFSVFDWMK